jgi:hypothetical protein
MVNPQEWFPSIQASDLVALTPDKQTANQSRPVRCRKQINIIHGSAGIFKCFFYYWLLLLQDEVVKRFQELLPARAHDH